MNPSITLVRSIMIGRGDMIVKHIDDRVVGQSDEVATRKREASEMCASGGSFG